jgi:hypothetical protein
MAGCVYLGEGGIWGAVYNVCNSSANPNKGKKLIQAPFCRKNFQDCPFYVSKAQTAAGTSVYCSNCGRQASGNFCSSCGNRLN